MPCKPKMALSRHNWYISGRMTIPNGRCCHLNWSVCVASVVSQLDSSLRVTSQCPLATLHMLKNLALLSHGRMLSNTGREYNSHLIALLRDLGSMQTLRYPLGLWAMTKLDTQLVECSSLMMTLSSSRRYSYLLGSSFMARGMW